MIFLFLLFLHKWLYSYWAVHMVQFLGDWFWNWFKFHYHTGPNKFSKTGRCTVRGQLLCRAVIAKIFSLSDVSLAFFSSEDSAERLSSWKERSNALQDSVIWNHFSSFFTSNPEPVLARSIFFLQFFFNVIIFVSQFFNLGI